MDSEPSKKETNKQMFMGVNIADPMVGGLLFFALGIIIAVSVLGASLLQNKDAPKNFAECALQRGSVIQESYPEVCVTEDGKRYTNENQKVEASPAESSWKSYTKTFYNYTVLYPKTWEIKETYQTSTRPSITFVLEEPVREESDVYATTAEIGITANFRSSVNQDESLKQYVLRRAENELFNLIDTEKSYLVATEDDLNTMTELTINGYDALLSEDIAYIDAGRYIFSFNLKIARNDESKTQSLQNIFKQVILSFSEATTLSPTPNVVETLSNRELCRRENGTWLEDYDECEGLDRDVCEEADGTYDNCASACRHDPTAGACIQLCVEVCSF